MGEGGGWRGKGGGGRGKGEGGRGEGRGKGEGGGKGKGERRGVVRVNFRILITFFNKENKYILEHSITPCIGILKNHVGQ